MRFTLLLFLLTFFGLANAQPINYEKGEVIIQLQDGTNPFEFIRQFESDTKTSILQLKTLSRTAGVHLVKLTDSEINLGKVISQLYTYREVINAQKNHLITTRETIPTDTLFAQQWFHKNTGQTGGTTDADIDTPDAWDITTGGVTTHDDTIVVCIIEGGGVDINHVDLVDNIWHNYAEIPDNGLDDDNNGYVDDFDGWNVSTLDDAVGFGSHGTRVAGMIGATGNNVTGVSGVNWDVKMMIVKGQVASNEASVIAAYDYPLEMRRKYNETFGAEGAFVVATNASWGINNGDPADAPIWCAMYDTLGTYGILNIAATTNSNVDVDVVGDLPTACPSQYLIGVTMSDDTDVRAGSGYGPTHVDLAAPGNSVHLPVPGNLYVNTNGTSFASPCVAGSVALAYSAPCPEFITFAKNDPAGAALQMKDFIYSSVDIIPALTGEVGTDGRLNIKSAIDSMLANCNVSACNQPYNLHLESLVDTAAHFAWDGFSTDYIFYIQEGNSPVVEIPLVNQDSIAFDTLLACSQYTVWVKSICGLDTSDFSFPLSFTTDGCCNNPNLTLDVAGVDSLSLSWNSVLYGTQYDIRYKIEGAPAWIDTLTDVTSPLNLNSLDTCVSYEIQIKTTCTDSTQGFGPSHIFSTLGCGACYEAAYCDVIGANSNSEWIDSIVIAWSVSATGSNGGYLQSTNILATFEPGVTYPVTLKPGYTSTTFTERFTIWVDVDFNGIFDATDVLLENVTTTSIINDNITIPSSAQYGITKMRIGMNGTTDPVACPTGNFWGEYEDYCVYIGEDAGISDEKIEVLLYPNPATNELNITSTAGISSVDIYSQDGKLVIQDDNFNGKLDISDLGSGFYIVHLQTENGPAVQKFVKQ